MQAAHTLVLKMGIACLLIKDADLVWNNMEQFVQINMWTDIGSRNANNM